MCKFEITLYPFCGYPYQVISSQSVRDPFDPKICRRTYIEYCERAVLANVCCISPRLPEAEYRAAIQALSDTVIRVDFNNCNLGPGVNNRGCRVGTPVRQIRRFGQTALYDMPPDRRPATGPEEDPYWEWYMSAVQKNV